MSVTLRRSALAAAAMLIAALPAEAQPARYTAAMMRDTVLENGLQVIAIRSPSSPMATAVIAIRGGAITQETDAVAGIPHFLEHMLFKSSDTFGREVSRLDGGANGTTSEEYVQYFVTAPGKNAPNVVRALADLVRNPRFSPKEMETEVRVVRNEIERNIGDRRFLLDFSVDQELWGASASRKNIGGNVFALRQATPQSIETMYKTFYTPENSALIVTGDINVAEVIAAARDGFKGWKKGSGQKQAPVEFAPLKATRILEPLDGVGSDITLLVAWHGPSAKVDSTGALSGSLVAAALNNRNSEFQRNLVDAGLFQSVSVEYRVLNHVAPIKIVASTSASLLPEATAALQAQLARLGSAEAFADEELRLAKKYWRVAAAREQERGSSLALNVAYRWSTGGLPAFLEEERRIDARTSADLRGFMQTYVLGKPKVVAIMIAPTSRQALGRDYQLAMGTWNSR